MKSVATRSIYHSPSIRFAPSISLHSHLPINDAVDADVSKRLKKLPLRRQRFDEKLVSDPRAADGAECDLDTPEEELLAEWDL